MAGAIQRWSHSRKGTIVGIDRSPDPGTQWMEVELVEDHELRRVAPGRGPTPAATGEIITLRRSFMTELDPQ